MLPFASMYLRMTRAIADALADGTFAAADRALGEVDDAAGIWSIERARDAAWVRAQLLYQVR